MGNLFVQHTLTQVRSPCYQKDCIIWDAQGPHLKYITAIELACQKLEHWEVEELRANVNRTLRSSHAPKSNLTKEEIKALREIRRYSNRTILTVDKWVAMVVMDRILCQ